MFAALGNIFSAWFGGRSKKHKPAAAKPSRTKPEIQLPADYAVPETDEFGNPYMILKDVHDNADGSKTSVEVRSDGIIVENENQPPTQIPLSAFGAALADIDEDIRFQITRKISLLVPTLADSKKELLVRHVFRALFLLAQDQLPRVRQMIAEELRESHNAPAELARKLAWDDDIAVSAPILEFSPLLNDHDLTEIISQSDIPGVLEAVAKRNSLSGDVSDAIVRNVKDSRIRNEDARIITALLENKGAEIRENTLEEIIEEAPNHEIWHASLIERPELTTRMINKVARFVSEALILEMKEQGVISRELGSNLNKAVSSRLHSPHVDRGKEAEKKAVDMFTQGTLDSEALIEALEAGEREFTIAAITLLAQLPKDVINKILESKEPKAITALVWKAGLSMRVAIPVQLKIAKVHYTNILYAKEGEHFPLTEKQMEKLLIEYIKKAA